MSRREERRREAKALHDEIERVKHSPWTAPERADLSDDANALAHWQTRRLSRTYTDLLHTERFKMATEFFLTDIYGPQDFSARDDDLERVYPIMARVMPQAALHSITLAVELHALSLELDARLLDELEKTGAGIATMSAETYAAAFRACDNYNDRKHQIELVGTVGGALDSVIQKPLVGSLVKIAHAPAQAAGFSDLQSFIERGFKAFKKMKGADDFIKTIQTRETLILDDIFAGRHVLLERDGPFTI